MGVERLLQTLARLVNQDPAYRTGEGAAVADLARHLIGALGDYKAGHPDLTTNVAQDALELVKKSMAHGSDEIE